MKNLLVILILSLSGSGFVFSQSNVSTFHRLIIYNADNEIMLVKIKGADVWVTPGFYQDSVQFIKSGLHDIASTYGIEVSNPVLKGTFLMRRERGAKTEMLIRNIFHCGYLSGEIHFPKNQSFEISEIKWLPNDEALKLVSFESMRMFMKQTHDLPNTVWGGSINVSKENGEWKYEVVEDFYPLFNEEND